MTSNPRSRIGLFVSYMVDSILAKLKKALWAALILVPVAYALNFYYAVNSGTTGGTFGDTFGAANAFFSGTALMMLVLAVILQREELEIIKDERNDTRALLEGQEEINNLQRIALEKQIFEQTFNSLLAITLKERARLNEKLVVNNRAQPSPLSYAARNAEFLLKELTKNPDTEWKKHNFQRTAACAAFFYASSLIHLATLVDQSTPDPEMRAPLRQIITSLLDPEIAYCVAWYAAEAKIQVSKSKNFLQFSQSYNIASYFDKEVGKSFLEFFET